MTVITTAQLQGLDSDIDTIDDVVESSKSTTTSKLGTIVRTLSGLAESIGYDVSLGVFASGKTIEFRNQVLSYDGGLYRPDESLPYTTDGATPDLDSGAWLVVSDGVLSGIARSLNVLDSQVIYSTDTVTPIGEGDGVDYIYNAATQTTWGIPSGVGAGETIQSVVDDQLTTDPSSTVYTLTTINKSGIEFEIIADIDNGDSIGGKVSLLVGDSVVALDYATGNNSGLLFFRVVAAGTGVDDGGKYINLPTLGLQLEQNLKTPYSIKAWGAAGDAQLPNLTENPTATDNTVMIQSTLDYAAIYPYRSSVYAPGGFYKITGELVIPFLDVGPRRGIKLLGDGQENSVIVGDDFDMIDFRDAFRGTFSFENIGFWNRPRNPVVAPVTNDTASCFFNSDPFSDPNDGVMKVDAERVLFRYFNKAAYYEHGGWNSKFDNCEFIECRYGLWLNRFYATNTTNCNFICGTAIYSDNFLVQANFENNHIDLGTYREVDGLLKPFKTIDIKTSGTTLTKTYLEVYGTLDPDHTVFEIESGAGDVSTFKNIYLNVGSQECILRRLTGPTAVSHINELTFEDITLIAQDTPTEESWFTWGASTTYMFYKYDSIPIEISSTNNPLLAQNNLSNKMYGTYDFDANTASQQLDLNAVSVTSSFQVTRNINWITVDGKLRLYGGYHKIAVTPQGAISEFDAGKKLWVEISGIGRMLLINGDESTLGRGGVFDIFITSAAQGGVSRELKLITEGFGTATPVTITLAISVDCIAGQRTTFN